MGEASNIKISSNVAVFIAAVGSLFGIVITVEGLSSSLKISCFAANLILSPNFGIISFILASVSKQNAS